MNERTLKKMFLFLIVAASFLINPMAAHTRGYRKQAASEADLVFRGSSPDSLIGMSMAAVGDVNADGRPDIVIGSPGSNSAYIVLGRSFKQEIVNVDIAGVPSHTGVVKIHCDLPGDRFGWSVSSAGDFNLDGIADIAIGWPGCLGSIMGPEVGGAAVILGNASWSTSAPLMQIGVSELIGQKGFLIRGVPPEDYHAGVCVAGGGDLNGDGFDDLVIAAPAPIFGPAAPARFYVVFGQPIPPASLDLEPVAGWGLRILCPMMGSFDPNTSSTICAWPGDLNRDGVDDLLLGTPLYPLGGQPEVGAAWVLFGTTTPFASSVNLEDIGTTVTGSRVVADPMLATNAHIGYAVAGLGDINGDRTNEFAVAIPDGKWVGQGGLVAVLYGWNGLPPIIDIQDPANGFWIVDAFGNPHDRFGVSVVGAGDPNNDGVPDIVIGAPSSPDPAAFKMQAGHAYVIYCDRPTTDIILTKPRLSAIPDMGVGKMDPLSQSVDRKFVDLVGVFGSVRSGQSGDAFGWSVCGPGDLNGDGVDDVFVGSPSVRTLFDAATPPLGVAFGFFFEPPRVLGVFLDDPNANRQADPGEHLNVVLNMPVEVSSGPVSNVFYVANTGQLGADAVLTQAQPGSNRFQIILGTSASIVVPGLQTAIDFAAFGERRRVLSTELGVNPIDSGIFRVNDTAIDVRFPLTAVSQWVSGPSGGAVITPPSADTRYDGHQLQFGPGALAASALVVLRQMPDPPGDFGLGAVWASVSQPFTRARLTLRYRDDDVPPHFDERQMRIVYITQSSPGVYELQIVPGVQVVDAVNNTITVSLEKSLRPSVESESPEPKAAGSASGFAGLPIETVDERTVTMSPSSGGGGRPVLPVSIGLAPKPGKTASVTLTPGPYSLYTKHQIVFYDYVTSTPGSVIATIRSAALAERTYINPVIGSQYFPDDSDAVFTIETTDASLRPTSFTTPVDFQVEFKPRDNPRGKSDVVDFDGNPGNAFQMQIVRSVQNPSNNVPNFVFVGGTQTVDVGNRVVQIQRYDNLTDAQGVATYGAVCDMTVLGAARWRLYR